MSANSAIIITIIVVFIAMCGVGVTNVIQSRKRAIQHQINARRRRIVELEEMRFALGPLVIDIRVIGEINSEILRLIHINLKTDPNGSYLQASLDMAQQIQQDVAQKKRKQALNRVMASSAAAAKAKYVLSEAAQVIKTRIAQKSIDQNHGNTLLNELIWSELAIDVITDITQGHFCKTAKDQLKAVSYYRKAEITLTESTLNDDRRTNMLMQVGDLLSGNKLSISPDLMPETKHNPVVSEVKAKGDDDDGIKDMTQKNYW